MILALDEKQERILSKVLARHAAELADKDISDQTFIDLEELAATEGLILQIGTAWSQRLSRTGHGGQAI